MGKATTMDAKDNEPIHVQRLKSVKLYNNPMDETTSAEMKINDDDPKSQPTGVAPPQQLKPTHNWDFNETVKQRNDLI